MLKFPRIDKIFSAFRSKPWCFWKPKSWHSMSRAEKGARGEKLAQAYLYRLKRQPETYRFDVVSIAFSGSNQHEISHYRNVALF